MNDRMLHQQSPWPEGLVWLVQHTRYRQGFGFAVHRDLTRGQGSNGATLVITVELPDVYHPERARRIGHYFPVPPAAYNVREWGRWLLDRIIDVETHEAMELFEVLDDDGDAHHLFQPHHENGRDPYRIPDIDEVVVQRVIPAPLLPIAEKR